VAIGTIQDVRDIGNLPDSTKLDDSILEPHQNSAARLLKKWIGAYETSTGDRKSRCIEAESCLTMYYSIPVLNTFFTEGVTTLQKEIGEMDFLFHRPDELETIRQFWYDRARDAVAEWLQEGERRPIGYYAI